MLFSPNAKINLGLLVHEQRSDGYHNIESFVYPVPLADVGEFIASPGVLFSDPAVCQCYGHQLDEHSENLCVKACRLIRDDYDIPPVQISLYKHIPIGAGLGGGSTDGVFMLKALNEYFSLGITSDALASYALRLGSDCPFFILNMPALVSGRGDHIKPVDLSLKGFHLAIIFPWIRISTKDAYAGLKAGISSPAIESVIAGPPESWRDVLVNHFENCVFEKYPVVSNIKENLYRLGAVYASMTGSGSAVYGLFRKPVVLRETFTQYFLWQGEL